MHSLQEDFRGRRRSIWIEAKNLKSFEATRNPLVPTFQANFLYD